MHPSRLGKCHFIKDQRRNVLGPTEAKPTKSLGLVRTGFEPVSPHPGLQSLQSWIRTLRMSLVRCRTGYDQHDDDPRAQTGG